ncbi:MULTISPECIES: TetR-like C-terminal domain-containing protein [Burkholderia]|uniref:TetR family transcriptional regulator n=1 Tax=Burkholderia paludis TaxID=1506587 RepID=A0A6J5DJH0_9BURK|nr:MULTISPECIES: TetR-like C-terminal domain-containing protein [Burkholderia]CAB3753371.1 HTH-type transcriptional regulator AqdR [Burkholderia paludis]VWB67084.1 TetR family transcriptional regulator [Burkholderia paludis]
MTETPQKRPRGRSTRVKNAVFDAVEALLIERHGEIPSMLEVAERAAVNKTSLYRRWGDIRNLMADVAIDRLIREEPIPTGGSVRENLVTWAMSIARSMNNQHSLSLLRVMAMTPQVATEERDIMSTPIGRRLEELDQMLEAARRRGDVVPSAGLIAEVVLAPIYMQALFAGSPQTLEGTTRRVDRAFLLAGIEAARDCAGKDATG